MFQPKVSAQASSRGIGFFGLLAVALIVLKLAHIIEWSWWWVLAPLWAPFVLVIVLIVGFVLWHKTIGR